MEISEFIRWCAGKKRGIRIVKPSENLCKAYLRKANDSLMSMKINREAGLRDWMVTTAYYARYNSVYALLMKFGIKSEIHDCSISLVKYLFSGKIDRKLIADIEKAKEQRINLQYYTDRTVPGPEINKNADSAPEFVLKIEKIIDDADVDSIKTIRNKLRETIKG